MRLLVTTLAENLAGSAPEDRPRAIEMVGALSRLVETAGVVLGDPAATAGVNMGEDAAAPSPGVSPS